MNDKKPHKVGDQKFPQLCAIDLWANCNDQFNEIDNHQQIIGKNIQ